jgi:AcrR family transcriptional regulator
MPPGNDHDLARLDRRPHASRPPVLEKHGSSGLNTNRVAEIAGVSVGTLYQYFPNKESLVAALQDRYIQQTVGFLRAVLASAQGVPIPDLVDRFAAALLAAHSVQRPIHRWLIELRSVAAFQERRRQALDEYANELTAFLAKRTDLQLADPASTAFVLVHAVEGVVSATTARDGNVNIASITAETCRMLRAYTAPKPTATY